MDIMLDAGEAPCRNTDVVVRSNRITSRRRFSGANKLCIDTRLPQSAVPLQINMNIMNRRHTHYRDDQFASFSVLVLFTYWIGVVIVPG